MHELSYILYLFELYYDLFMIIYNESGRRKMNKLFNTVSLVTLLTLSLVLGCAENVQKSLPSLSVNPSDQTP